MIVRWEHLGDAALGTGPPAIKNHTATAISSHEMLVFGGYDGRRNHNSLYMYDCRSNAWHDCSNKTHGETPAGRNGHTATLAEGRIYVIGGWLGSGPFAAADLHVLDLSTMTWSQPPVQGAPPGPCNMHTAEYVPHLRSILLFRGGDGREYLNDLYALAIDTLEWSPVAAEGPCPSPRANHSAAIVPHDQSLLIFGGWDGHHRLNDIYALDTHQLVWSRIDPPSPSPYPMHGMSLAAYGDNLFVFGGSGPAGKYYNDLHVFDPVDNVWVQKLAIDEEEERKCVTAEDESDPFRTSDQFGNHRVSIMEQQLLDYGFYDGDGDANPNETPRQNHIVVLGDKPSRRAGHTCTMLDRKLFIFGGSHSNEYLHDLIALDMDPAPRACISYASSTQTLQRSLRRFLDSDEFSDISFLVDGHVVYAHKIILSLLSERFRVMFTSGFREAEEKMIPIPDISHRAFVKMLEYLYTGQVVDCIGGSSRGSSLLRTSGRKQVHSQAPTFEWCEEQSSLSADDDGDSHSFTFDGEEDNTSGAGGASDDGLELMLELLVAADQFMLDHLKQVCEQALQYAVSEETVGDILYAADRSNALQLKAVCIHYLRNHDSVRARLSWLETILDVEEHDKSDGGTERAGENEGVDGEGEDSDDDDEIDGREEGELKDFTDVGVNVDDCVMEHKVDCDVDDEIDGRESEDIYFDAFDSSSESTGTDL